MTNVRRTRLIWLVLILWGLRMPLQVLAQDNQAPPPQAPSPGEIDQLVAPVALYPDPLLAQVLMASTYPLEIVQAARWRQQNPKVEGTQLDDELKKQDWDDSVKSLISFPPVLTMMNDKLDWTEKLGDAFLAQQKDVMDGVQRLRKKAQAEGNLKSTAQQTVTTEQVAVEAAPAPAAPPAPGAPPPPPPPPAAPPPQEQVIVIQPTN